MRTNLAQPAPDDGDSAFQCFPLVSCAACRKQGACPILNASRQETSGSGAGGRGYRRTGAGRRHRSQVGRAMRCRGGGRLGLPLQPRHTRRRSGTAAAAWVEKVLVWRIRSVKRWPGLPSGVMPLAAARISQGCVDQQSGSRPDLCARSSLEGAAWLSRAAGWIALAVRPGKPAGTGPWIAGVQPGPAMAPGGEPGSLGQH